MLSKEKFKDLSEGVTVEEFIEILKEYPPTAHFTVMGDPCIYLHMEEDESAVIVDDNSLSEEYED